MGELLDVLIAAWPIAVETATILWLFFASPFAWWLSGLLSKRVCLRLLWFLLLWLALVIVKLILFVRMMVRGVSPWKQWHAWRMFEKIVKCFVQSKKDTVIFSLLTMILCIDESKDKAEEIDIDVHEIANDSERGCFCPVSLTRMLRIVFCLTDGDREYLQNFFSLMKRNKIHAFWHGPFNAVMDIAQKWDLIKARKNIFVVGNSIADKAIEFACANGDRELAESVVRVRLGLRDLELSDVAQVGEKAICELVDELAIRINDAGGKLYVVCKMKAMEGLGTSKPKLIEMKSQEE